MLVDPVGDAYLIRKLDTIPIKLSSYFFHHSLPQADLAREKRMRDDVGFQIGKTLSFDIDRLLNACAGVMRKHYLDFYPVVGEEHKWSPDARRYMRYGFWHRLWRYGNGKQQDFPMPLLMRSKLLLCLACGWTSRYCVTGTEAALEARIMSYTDGSVQLLDLFTESYVLNKGNVYLTFLACENVLAGLPHRLEREEDPLQRKLSYIRHDSREAGDNYGAWYHFFGVALYGLVRSEDVSVFVADTESMGSFFMEGPDEQEDLINHYGAIFGSRFRKMMDEGTWRFPSKTTDRTDYMLPNPFYNDRSEMANPPERAM